MKAKLLVLAGTVGFALLLGGFVEPAAISAQAQTFEMTDAPNTSAPRRQVKRPRRKASARTTSAKKPSALSRPDFSEGEQQHAEIPGFPDVRFWGNCDENYARKVPSTPGPWLVLSTGGEDGAYGVGFLNGWTAARNRPDFSVITGISTGALMAVYAFAGPKYDAELRAAYTSINAGDIFEMNRTPESLVDSWPLKRLIEKGVTAELLADVAEQYKRGRRLFVVTTNLDAGRPIVWDMGKIAATTDAQALTLFRDVLLASASVPGVFQPVYIEVEANGRRFKEMHVDGGVNGPMYVAPESYLLPGSSRRLPISQLYVILNGTVTTEFSAPPRAVEAILARSFSLALRLGARLDLFLFHEAARRDGIDFNLALAESAIDIKAHGAFDPDYMKALYERGFEHGKTNQFLTARPFRRPTAVNEGSVGVGTTR